MEVGFFIIEPSDPCPRCLTLGTIMRPRGISKVVNGKIVSQSEKVCVYCGFVARKETKRGQTT